MMSLKSAVLIFGLLLENISAEVVDQWNVTCPSACRCDLQHVPAAPERLAIRTVDCSHQKLHHLPLDIPTDVQALLLKNNIITKLAEASFEELNTLQILDLSYNDIEHLGPPSVFGNMSSLQILNLEGNQINTIAQGSFSGLTGLEELHLSVNQLTGIQEYGFSGLHELKVLILSRNNLPWLKPEWFANLPSLQSLSVDHNQLVSIDGGSFLGMTSLTKLSLSHNNLTSLSGDGFMGLSQLNQLDLSHNELGSVPRQALSIFKRLKLLTLDSNPISILLPGSFQALTVGELSLCNMSILLSLDRHSIVNLPQLHTLRIHSNPRLIYMHPESLEDLPQLENLQLHENHLAVVYYDVVQALPALQQLTLHANPFQCDCNAFWVKMAMMNESSYVYNDSLVTIPPPIERVTFPNTDNFFCDTPPGENIRHLADIPISSLTPTCKPTVIALFNDSYQKEIGKSVTFECRAIGVPPPSIHWILSNGEIVRSSTNLSRIRVSRTGTLSVENLKADHAGTYTCVATNAEGYDTTNTVLRVHSKNINILDQGSTNSFVTVSWNGTESTIATSDYVIMYREFGTHTPYGKVHLRPYMRKYTISDLKPETTYEFCIAYEEHSKTTVKLHCMNIKTKSQLFMMHGIRTISKLTILLALCLTSLGVILICVLMVIVRRYQRRKSYQDPAGGTPVTGPQPLGNGQGRLHSNHHRPADQQKIGQISNIPLDNLYNPPRTPLCTSTTSLISCQSNA